VGFPTRLSQLASFPRSTTVAVEGEGQADRREEHLGSGQRGSGCSPSAAPKAVLPSVFTGRRSERIWAFDIFEGYDLGSRLKRFTKISASRVLLWLAFFAVAGKLRELQSIPISFKWTLEKSWLGSR